MSRMFGSVPVGCIVWMLVFVAAESASAQTSARGSGPVGVVDLFEAEEQNLVGVQFIPNDAKSAQVILTNKTRRPLTLRLPAAFVGVPVLAQFGVGGGFGGAAGGGAGFGGPGMGGGAQATGGGLGQGNQGGGGLGGLGGGFQSIPPERTRVLRVPTVCLEYGKREPSPRMPYRLVPAESFSSDPQVSLVLELLGKQAVPQKVAQAAAWHFSSGLSWEQLAREKIDHLGATPDEPYFSARELGAARQLVVAVTEESRRRQGDGSTPIASASQGQ